MIRQTDYSKGDATRPMFVSREERDLRYALAYGEITREQFEERLKDVKDARD